MNASEFMQTSPEEHARTNVFVDHDAVRRYRDEGLSDDQIRLIFGIRREMRDPTKLSHLESTPHSYVYHKGITIPIEDLNWDNIQKGEPLLSPAWLEQARILAIEEIDKYGHTCPHTRGMWWKWMNQPKRPFAEFIGNHIEGRAHEGVRGQQCPQCLCEMVRCYSSRPNPFEDFQAKFMQFWEGVAIGTLMRAGWSLMRHK